MLFMNTSYRRAVEREMQTIPNFKPRRSGFQVNEAELYRMSEAYFSVMDRLKSFLEKPIVNAYIIDEVPQKTNPLGYVIFDFRSCRDNNHLRFTHSVLHKFTPFQSTLYFSSAHLKMSRFISFLSVLGASSKRFISFVMRRIFSVTSYFRIGGNSSIFGSLFLILVR